jgi:1-deoxy-D-xylulose 5-phosphate reductoisomerase-like protein
MKPNVLRATSQQSAHGQRSVTLLGATGSIGASTIDLLKRERERFRVEAVSANKSAAALAALARDTPPSAIPPPMASSRRHWPAPVSPWGLARAV